MEKKIIYFEAGKSELTSDSKEILKKTIKGTIPENIHLTIEGYTDGDGSDEYNKSLSNARALTTARYFIANGFNKNQIEVNGYGKRKPMASNESAEGKQKNRRVEVSVQKKNIEKHDLLSQHTKRTQHFTISSREDVFIEGNEGTKIKIPKNSLTKKNGELVSSDIEIELIEFYKKSDMLASDLHTMSGNEILETAGMIYISAKYAGEDLELREEEEIEIKMASGKKINGMQTFIGELQNGQINWVQIKMVSGKKIKEMQTLVGESQSEQINWVPKNSRQTILLIRNAESGYVLDTTTIRKQTETDEMIINSTSLGWINCDRFSNFQSKTNLLIDIDTVYKPVVRLVFKNINSIMPGYYTKEKKIILSNVPVGEKATIIVFGFINNEQYFTSKDIIISVDPIEKLKLSKMTADEIKKELQKLN
jgi:hypothetical protein